MTQQVVFLSAVRTAIGGFGGSLKDVPATTLAAAVTKEAVSRAGLQGEQIGHCVFGNVLHTDRRDMYISRVAALEAGLPVNTPALTVNRLCGSGLQAIITAAQQIELGVCNAAVAGGAEAMSRAQYWVPAARFGQRMGDSNIIDSMTGALTCPMENYHMGVTAENVAEEWSISREQQDALAALSHQRAQKAIESGLFESQILPIEIKTRKGMVSFNTDEHVRYNCTADEMEQLRPVFKKEGSVTAGNASGLNDAAAAVTMMSADEAKRLGLTPMAKLVGYSFAAVEPKIMGIGPVPAIRQLLEKHQLSVSDIDVWEVNEAFAAQALAVAKELNLPEEKLNVNGSGISLGHPVGATGAIVTVKALYELERIQGRYAIISLCIGGGQGIAMLIER
ncbi:acetyl-CoA C-acetyltransferase [Oceanospirillum multiglobuliferum]|uniref:Acetyl-CoA acetyltransferase n=1 Tax=Oceanospirillum multiglobuliferum TaxID=64969 RepID=A0A1T4KVL1_9GAMM|nr:beta-ketothiolase BktB [Oceanospirillum multiglobuliferum]OPX54969.1 acetyl-CoA acetyltransferase [Oceanospirillum multiglobuliferum]SJZ46482.1 acetyl-CoA C-acetyltransferase [Oceanospirillum multiglobuliferum]